MHFSPPSYEDCMTGQGRHLNYQQETIAIEPPSYEESLRGIGRHINYHHGTFNMEPSSYEQPPSYEEAIQEQSPQNEDNLDQPRTKEKIIQVCKITLKVTKTILFSTLICCMDCMM